MKKTFILFLSLIYCISAHAQVKFEEYDLNNGLHVILHENHRAPVVAVTVMYHVGSKNESPNRTGFAHFFEHLLFEGSENIPKGEFLNIVSNNGGRENANTTQDRTFFYELFPSNQLKLGLWLESERMLHPVINETGVKTENEVVKAEKRQRVDNQPYGRFAEEVFKRLFINHPYRWQPIGSMNDLDSAKLPEFKTFFKRFYVPSNAVITIAGDINPDSTKKLIEAYFLDIPSGQPVKPVKYKEPDIVKALCDTVYDSHIQVPAIINAYRVPGRQSRDSKILTVISSVLSEGSSSVLKRKLIDEKKTAHQILSFDYSLEDYGVYILGALPNGNVDLKEILADIDGEILKLQTGLVSDVVFRRIQNKFENNYIDRYSGMVGVAQYLSEGYLLYEKDTNHVNEELSVIRSITKAEIMSVARKYLNPEQRLQLYYLPTKHKL